VLFTTGKGYNTDTKPSSSINVLAPTLYPFFRHTIPNVRLAVVRTLQSFMVVSTLSKDWVNVPFLCLLFQNMAIEEHSDIRDATLAAWKTALQVLGQSMSTVISQQLVLQWYEISMTPLGAPINTASFYTPALSTDGERHNVDKHMLMQDLALVSMESIFKARIAASTGLAQLLVYWPDDVSVLQRHFIAFLNRITRHKRSTNCSGPSSCTTLSLQACCKSS
jgi:TATA-binding protein-associated factor